jgi:hypothetical protein
MQGKMSKKGITLSFHIGIKQHSKVTVLQDHTNAKLTINHLQSIYYRRVEISISFNVVLEMYLKRQQIYLDKGISPCYQACVIERVGSANDPLFPARRCHRVVRGREQWQFQLYGYGGHLKQCPSVGEILLRAGPY